ncbi:MAG: 3-oxoacyl-ACP reductase FabG [candidate division NC10 bacterium]|nr:3-oxoacyl-ACP reductase FabG [candidate division NC10 bacterium]MBI2162992.1 3-oxoacyl-ACP reductase FabG [candidate division NC10 bacterium]
MRFDGKVAIVTGSSDGIGRAAALIFAREGGQVVLNARGQDRLEATRTALQAVGKPPLVVAGNVSQAAVVERLVGETLQQFGRMDILVNNAGGGTLLRFLEEVTEEEWDLTVDSNLKSAFLCCKAVAPAMKRQQYGRIVNVSSVAGRNVSRLSGPQYSSAKAGMLGLTRHLAQDLGPFGITANAVAPGPTLVDRVARKWALRSEEDRARILANIPLGRLAAPEEVATVIAFLASDDAAYVTGVTIDVNGGSFMC